MTIEDGSDEAIRKAHEDEAREWAEEEIRQIVGNPSPGSGLVDHTFSTRAVLEANPDEPFRALVVAWSRADPPMRVEVRVVGEPEPWTGRIRGADQLGIIMDLDDDRKGFTLIPWTSILSLARL